MTRLSVCIEMFWGDLPMEERIARVAALGFPAFEFWGWKNKDIPAIKAAMTEHNIPIAALCLEPGHSLIRRHYEAEMVQAMKDTAAVAAELNCKTIIATVGNTIDDESYEISRRRVVRNVRAIGKVAEDHGLTIVLEPLNTLVDHHGYWLRTMAQAVDIVQEVGSPAVKILMDIYHQQITEGNNIANLTEYIDEIGHFHTAGVPGRHELVGGEQDYRAIFKAIDATGYDGYVGLEYRPTMDTEESLKQALSLVED
ncbi:MAG: hydroxypyruvate isomerase family protein [Anaerolineae bacterium]|jgi:hydroxypyruvate isomerase